MLIVGKRSLQFRTNFRVLLINVTDLDLVLKTVGMIISDLIIDGPTVDEDRVRENVIARTVVDDLVLGIENDLPADGGHVQTIGEMSGIVMKKISQEIERNSSVAELVSKILTV